MKRLYIIFSLLMLFSMALSAQIFVSGTVQDPTGEALIGANVIGVGTSVGTVTDIDGNFTLALPEGTQEIEVSYTGFGSRIIDLNGQSVFEIVLQEGEFLDELVVVGYETVKRSNIVSAVSTVKAEDIAKVPIASIDNLLQGQAAGVNVTAINGKPGQNAYVRVRGLTSILGNNQALFIVDGVPVPPQVFSALNPSDIEDIQVLKDAASTSVYGSRGSAGVVLVTTKKGNSGYSYIEYSFQGGIQKIIDDRIDLMSPEQKVDYEIGLGLRNPNTRDAVLAHTTDWEEELLRDGSLLNHNLSFSGGNERGTYFASISAFDQQGLSVGSDLERYNLRLNGELKLNDWVTVHNSLLLSRRDENELRDRFNVQSPFYAVYAYNPYETVFNLDENGNPITNADGNPSYNLTHQGFNIVEAIQNNPETLQSTDLIGNAGIDITPVDGLTLKSQLGFVNNVRDNTYRILPGSILDGYIGDPDAPGFLRVTNDTRRRLNWINSAQYQWTIKDNDFSVLAGTEYVKGEFERISAEGKGIPAQLNTLAAASEIEDGTSFTNEFALFSIFGTARFSHADKYLLSATLRRDGSSRFGENNRYGVFYAFGAGWNLHNEDWFDSAIFDQLKLRASYGVTGNEPNSLYDHLGVFSFGAYQGVSAAGQTVVANPDLKWEENQQFSFGVDFGMWNNKLSGSLEYYQKNARDMLFPQELSRTTGFSSRTANIGDMTNNGIEAELVYRIINRGDFTLSVDAQLATQNNKITRLEVAGADPNEDAQFNPQTSYVSVFKENETAYTYELVEYVGVDSETGDLLYLDAEGNETTMPTASDAQVLSGKTPYAKFLGGFGFNVGYKGLSLNTDFVFKQGNYIYNGRLANLLGGINAARSQQMVEALDYWREPGDVTDIPRPELQVEPVESTRFLEKGDYIRLRQVQLSYSLPKSLIENMGLQGLNIFVSGTNLLTWTGFTGDPEVGVLLEESISADAVSLQVPGEYYLFSYPNAKAFTGGITVRF